MDLDAGLGGESAFASVAFYDVANIEKFAAFRLTFPPLNRIGYTRTAFLFAAGTSTAFAFTTCDNLRVELEGPTDFLDALKTLYRLDAKKNAAFTVDGKFTELIEHFARSAGHDVVLALD